MKIKKMKTVILIKKMKKKIEEDIDMMEILQMIIFQKLIKKSHIMMTII